MDKPNGDLPEIIFDDKTAACLPNARQEAAFSRLLELQALLVGRLIDGSGLDELTGALAEFMNCGVLIEDAGSSHVSVDFPTG